MSKPEIEKILLHNRIEDLEISLATSLDAIDDRIDKNLALKYRRYKGVSHREESWQNREHRDDENADIMESIHDNTDKQDQQLKQIRKDLIQLFEILKEQERKEERS